MSLPQFNANGDLPAGLYRASLNEVMSRFGSKSPKRREATEKLQKIHELVHQTGKLLRLIVFGSYVSEKLEPNDIDIILVMQDDFLVTECTLAQAIIFDHQRAQKELGASIFWICPSGMILETVDEFLAHWQLKRDRTRRGIIEITQEE